MLTIGNIRNALGKLNPRDPVAQLYKLVTENEQRSLPGRKIALFGDNATALHITESSTAKTLSDRGYFHWANAMLGGAFALGNVYGYNGATSSDLVAAIKTVINSNPDYVSLMVGVHDVNAITNTATAATAVETYKRNINKIAEDFKANGIRLILCTPTPVTAWYTASQATGDAAAVAKGTAQINAYHQMVKGLRDLAIQDGNITLVDTGGAILDIVGTRPLAKANGFANDATTDGTNLSPYGAYQLGRAIAATLRGNLTRIVPTIIGRTADAGVNLTQNGGLNGTNGTKSKSNAITNAPTGDVPTRFTYYIFGASTAAATAAAASMVATDHPAVKTFRSAVTGGDSTTQVQFFADATGLTPGKKYEVAVSVRVSAATKLKYLQITAEARNISTGTVKNYGFNHESNTPDLDFAPLNINETEDLTFVIPNITLPETADRIRVGLSVQHGTGMSASELFVSGVSVTEVQ